jgi:hypothetical protein
MSSQKMFTVRVTVDAPEGAGVVERLVDALNELPHLAHSAGVRFESDYVELDYEPVSDDARTGPTATEPAAPGADLVAGLGDLSRDHSLAVPAVRAMITTAAALDAAGLPPRREMRVDVTPAPRLPQDVLSTHRSESVHPPEPTFGGP